MNIAKKENDISEIKLKHDFNFQSYLLDGETIKYCTWIYDSDLGIYFDIIFTSKRIIVIGDDYISSFIYKKISHIMIYYGNTNEGYAENYLHYNLKWRFGNGEDKVLFCTDTDNFSFNFSKNRFSEAVECYQMLTKLWFENC